MEGAEARGEREVMDLPLFMLHVLPVLVITLLAPFLGSSLSLLLQVLVLSYIFWIQKGCSERERLQIQVEERKKINAKKAMSEGETLRWMNEGLKVMWPISMQNFASKHFFIPMAPWFLERFKPAYVKEVTLQSLHLGNTPPHFSLIRALPSPQDGDDAVFEANMEFLSDKDMNAEMTVQMRGMKITFYISRLYIKGVVKFSVKFVKGWPVIGRVRFSFAETPIVNMTARPWYGPDMRFFPGAAKWLEETLGTALEQSVVEPYMLAINFEKLVSNMMISALMPRQDLQEFFSVEPKSGVSQTVRVEILEAGDLKPPNGASKGLPDLFVRATLGAYKRTTNMQTKTLKPIWAEEVKRIPIVNWALPNLLTLQVISKKSMKIHGQRQLGICSVPVNDYRNGERHVMKVSLVNDRKDSTGWIRVAITVENSQGVEEPGASIGSQPTTRDLESISPPLSAAATTISAPLTHTRSTSTEDIAAPHEASEEVGSSEIIKMPYGTDGAFSIEYPGEGESLCFSDPPTTRKPQNEKAAFVSKDGDAKVKRSMMSILGRRKRSTGKVSQDISPPEREMTLSEHSGYSSSLDRSTELKIYHGIVNLNLLSPEKPSREPPHEDIRLPKLETVFSENREAMKTPDLDHGNNNINLTEPQPHLEVKGSSFSRELIFSPQREQEPEKQHSKNSWWKSLTKRPKRRTSRGSSKPNTVLEHDQPEDESYDPSDTSASQSFRKEPQDLVKELFLHPEDNVTTTDNGHSILTCGRSKSCRQDSHSKKIGSRGGLSQSMRLDPSPSLLKTIHEKQGLDRPQH